MTPRGGGSGETITSLHMDEIEEDVNGDMEIPIPEELMVVEEANQEEEDD